ncbi:AAA domain-containing protein [Sediminibacillus terrae]|uniref:AAA domain-containing protein n=1 Tax=Sediminibacillus terrae TaxID=1562106 RepID=UPI001F2044D8|nr:AAA domain-containing protein [Sediminibacillus terrae]
MVPEDVREKTSRIFAGYTLDDAYHYAEHSLLSSITALYEDIPKTLLKEHYRCHPKIIGFCNNKFYNNELVVLTDEKEKKDPLVLYKTVKGNHARGTVNQRQIDVVLKEIIPEQKLFNGTESLGIITPFRRQADKFNEEKNKERFEVDTVHKYQGREKDTVILSTVSNEISTDDFVDDANLVNVAVSRAVNQLIVVVASGGDKWKGTNVGDLVRYIKYNNFEVIESKVRSVFDLLYKDYSSTLKEVMKRRKRVSAHASENLLHAVIESVLKQPEFQSLDFVMHQPLRMLIKDPTVLTPEERKFAMNIFTHTDFVIFNKLDKMPVLVVEVDGHAFHANNPVQQERDKMKDRILKKYGITIERMETTGSEEELKLRNKLLKLV